jgi:hypothetical protein
MTSDGYLEFGYYIGICMRNGASLLVIKSDRCIGMKRFDYRCEELNKLRVCSRLYPTSSRRSFEHHRIIGRPLSYSQISSQRMTSEL